MPTKKKTATKKVATKKTSAPAKAVKEKAKKVTKKVASKSAEKKLVAAKGSNCFWVNQGPILRDLMELEAALAVMNDLVFAHHVTKERNDFAEWVEHVLRDGDTAAALRKAKKPNTAHKIVVRQLKLYRLPN